jgi:hypothetical protein
LNSMDEALMSCVQAGALQTRAGSFHLLWVKRDLITKVNTSKATFLCQTPTSALLITRQTLLYFSSGNISRLYFEIPLLNSSASTNNKQFFQHRDSILPTNPRSRTQPDAPNTFLNSCASERSWLSRTSLWLSARSVTVAMPWLVECSQALAFRIYLQK